MRFISGYDWRAVETIPAPRVAWQSQFWDAVSVKVSRTIGGPMVDGWADMIQATAEVVLWSPDVDVESEGLNLPDPSRNLPRRGDAMDAYLGDDRGVLRVITGRVMSVSVPSALSPELSVTLGDLSSRFDYPITINPLGGRHPVYLRGHPPVTMGLHTSGVVNRIFRWRGFYTTPERIGGAVLSVPLVGDARPEVGTLVASSLNDPAPNQVGPLHRSAPWGVAVHNLNHIYELTAPVTGTLYLTGLLASPTAPSGGVVLRLFGDKGVLEVRFTGSSMRVEHGGITVGTVPTAVASEEADIHWAVWIGDNGGVVVQIGATTAVVLGTLPATAGATWDRLGILTPARGGVQVAGVQVVPNPGTISDRHQVPGQFTRTGHIRTSATHGRLHGIPALVDRNALGLLKEIAQAERAAAWVDEDGHAHYRHRSSLYLGGGNMTTGPIRTLVGADELIDLSWDATWQSSLDSVTVHYARPTAQVSKYPNITLWSASPRLGPLDSHEEFFGPEADEDWARVDTAIGVLSYAATPSGMYARNEARHERGSFWTAVVESEEDNGAPPGDWVAFNSTAAVSVTQIVPDRWLLSARTLSKSDGEYGLVSTQEAHFRVPDPEDFPAGNSSKAAAELVRPSLWGTDGIVVRGKMRQTWTEQTTTVGSGVQGGTVEHQAGHWVQLASDVADLGEYLHAFLADDRPVWADIPVAPDIRRQVGDIIRIEIGPIQSRALILSITDEAKAGQWRQSLTLQTIGDLTDA